MIDSWTVLKDVVLSCSSQMVESVSSRLSFHPRLKKISSHRAPMRPPIPQVLKQVLWLSTLCSVLLALALNSVMGFSNSVQRNLIF